jgi:tetratricopeptide (TPR) repeat protein
LTTTATCADLDANWGHNWPGVLEALDGLIAAGQSCGPEPLVSKKYAVHFNYAASLEEAGDSEQAIAQYQAALRLAPQRTEALSALVRLQSSPSPTPPACLSDSPPRPDPAQTVSFDPSQFVTAQTGQLHLAGQPFYVRGVNYYPRQAPWERFFSEADPAQMARELAAIRAAGFNTLRIFLPYQPLFTCQPEDAIPNEANFARLDTLFRLAGEHDLKLIVTLNDVPDLLFRPLYTDWEHYDAQTVYIVRRYRHEPALLAWDMRNGGDSDYDDFHRAAIIDWLAHLSGLIRQHDPNHLITAGWDADPAATAPYVDILSLQYWAEPDELQAQLEAYQTTPDKPVLLLSTGHHSFAESPDEPHTEQEQAAYLGQMIRAAEQEKLAGWLIWTAFDFVPAPGQAAAAGHHFGLWRTDLSPKPALEALPLEP